MQPAPDPEEERVKKRNALRTHGVHFDQERVRLSAAWEAEDRVYKLMLKHSRGQSTSPFFKQAAQALRRRDTIGVRLETVQSRINTIEGLLESVDARAMDQDFVRLVAETVRTERNAPQALSRDEVGQILQEATELTSENRGLERDLAANEVVPPTSESSLLASMQADYAALTESPSPSVVVAAAAGAADATVTAPATRAAVSESVEAEILARMARRGPGSQAAPGHHHAF